MLICLKEKAVKISSLLPGDCFYGPDNRIYMVLFQSGRDKSNTKLVCTIGDGYTTELGSNTMVNKVTGKFVVEN